LSEATPSALPESPLASPLGIASPLTLLHEEEAAEEVLSLSYTLNLGFWERYALSVARSLGARVTVVSDATMATVDIGHVHYAGITYLNAWAVCKKGGAFHPKLLVIAGKDFASVAIGSGNVTLPGWHGNAELWTVLRGDNEGAPETFAQLAAWLRALPSQVVLSPGVAGDKGALVRVADRLDRFPADEPGPLVVTSLERRIVEQLPVQAVGELVLSAPYHGPMNSATATLVRRFSPTHLRVLLQPAQTVVDGLALADFLRRHNGTAESILEKRFCHGKLYEWTMDGGRHALVGSPNLTTSALERSMAEGGNCELALLCELEESIVPETGDVSDGSLMEFVYEPRQPTTSLPGLILLGATVASEGIKLHLHRPLAEPAVLEVAEGELWQELAELPRDETKVDLAVPVQAGRAVRVVTANGLVSNICFVTDPSRVLRTRVPHVGRSQTDEGGVFEDARIADALAFDLAELRQFLPERPRPPSGGGGGEGSAGVREYRSWEEYLDLCSAHIGERLLAYGLALPWLSADVSPPPVDEDTIGDFEDDDPDAGTEPEDDPSDGIQRLDAQSRSQSERRRYQSWCERVSELSPVLVPAARLVILRLLLRAVAGGLYERHAEWVPRTSCGRTSARHLRRRQSKLSPIHC
jgi:hypothetical protein